MGETARTGYERTGEHFNDLEAKTVGKPLADHSKDDHDNNYERDWFKVKILKKYRTPLQRQIAESIEIEESSADILLNRKN